MENYNRDFGGLLEQTRKDKSIGLRAFARLLEVTPAYLNDIEKGRRKAPRIDKIEKIVYLLQLEEAARDRLFDLAGESRKEIPLDLQEYICSNEELIAAIRLAKKKKVSQECWAQFINDLSKEYL